MEHVDFHVSLSAFRRHLKSELFLSCFGLGCVSWFCSAFLISLYHTWLWMCRFYCKLSLQS